MRDKHQFSAAMGHVAKLSPRWGGRLSWSEAADGYGPTACGWHARPAACCDDGVEWPVSRPGPAGQEKARHLCFRR